MTTTNRLPLACAALLLALSAGCGSGPPLGATTASMPAAGAPTPTSTTTATTTTSTITTTTTTTLATTTTGPEPSRSCESEPDVDLPTDVIDPISVTGDVDADGFEDTVTGYLVDGEAYLHVELSTGWGTAVRVDPLDGEGLFSRPSRVVTMAGEQLVVAMIGQVLPGTFHALLAFRDCALAPVLASDGRLPDLWNGGGAAHDDWFACMPDGVTMIKWAVEDPLVEPATYLAATATGHRYESQTLQPLGEVDLGLAFPIGQEAALDAYPSCGHAP